MLLDAAHIEQGCAEHKNIGKLDLVLGQVVQTGVGRANYLDAAGLNKLKNPTDSRCPKYEHLRRTTILTSLAIQRFGRIAGPRRYGNRTAICEFSC